MFLKASVHHLLFLYISTGMGCSGVHELVSGFEPTAHSQLFCQVAVVRGTMSLWPTGAQYFWDSCEEGMERAVHPLPLVEFVLPLQSAEEFLSESTYGTSIQEQFVCLWKGPKGTKRHLFSKHS